MKIAAAQVRPVKGAIAENIEIHKQFISRALSLQAAVIVFPELSLTGYEPGLAAGLATAKEDSRFEIFQAISNKNQVIICAGMPVKSRDGILVGMLIFQPGKPRLLYAKQYLHQDELSFFVPGHTQVFISAGNHKIAPVICYELSVAAHAANAAGNVADIYLVSVAKTAGGIQTASETLAGIAAKYGMQVVLANCTGYCDNFEAAGHSAAWDNNGVQAGSLKNTEGILVFDTGTGLAAAYEPIQ